METKYAIERKDAKEILANYTDDIKLELDYHYYKIRTGQKSASIDFLERLHLTKIVSKRVKKENQVAEDSILGNLITNTIAAYFGCLNIETGEIENMGDRDNEPITDTI